MILLVDRYCFEDNYIPLILAYLINSYEPLVQKNFLNFNPIFYLEIAMRSHGTIIFLLILSMLSTQNFGEASDYQSIFSIVDTNQNTFFDNFSVVDAPEETSIFKGQDAGYSGLQLNYKDNGDGTVTDMNTGLMWQKEITEKMSYDTGHIYAVDSSLAGYSDWRIPTIKELYSLIIFSGKDPSGWEGTDVSVLTPFIDPVFEFVYGDATTGERIIDAQYLSTTKYVGLTMNGDDTIFGVNFADGRIKGYGMIDPRTQMEKTFFVKLVRGNENYGKNSFVDNGDGTISDLATGLMWMKSDSQKGMNWEEALGYAENLEYAGYTDWRLPNAKELQSIVDYSNSPSTNGFAAIDSIFEISTITDEGGNSNYPFFWTSTTHENMFSGEAAVYIAFGEALGWMQFFPNGGYELLDVHGAGAQRSDPKTGDKNQFPYGHGPQGDVIRIQNYVRAVRMNSVAINSDILDQASSKESDSSIGNYVFGFQSIEFMITVSSMIYFNFRRRMTKIYSM